ncbi:MAG TPA: dienelactone hydrolase family protein [Syntrophales bacterium]|nr:dienelactone hydrolase family protein [Syntrophales bacterium]
MNRSGSDRGREQEVVIPVGASRIPGILGVPSRSKGLVVFAHGSGSGRLSPRNNYVASVLQEGGLSTLLVDLLEEAESLDRRKVFDIDLLADRLLAIARWSSSQRETRDLMLGYFGASTGAGAALQAAAREPLSVKAVVSRGGRPDLAMSYLSRVQAPTLLIVGGNDKPVISMNEAAYAKLQCLKKLVIVPGATHLFEEPGTLETVAQLALDWFIGHFVPQDS